MTKLHQPTAEEVAKVIDFLDSRPDAWRCFADHPPIMRDIARHAFAFVHGFRAEDVALQAEWARQLADGQPTS